MRKFVVTLILLRGLPVVGNVASSKYVMGKRVEFKEKAG